ncbi:helix-turn-helix domain-containing protein [Amycolatopsis minnesotensis]|uniref:NACHT domain-containing protein n=1 Tax=Amycolatopsis minnesotensis TaxID=337894 RepID=A0ABN2SLE4_9PSEU
MSTEFSGLLRRLRQQAGITQEALAERSGVGVRTIRGLETGERADPRVTTVRLLAEALELRPQEREDLLGAAVGRAVGRAVDEGPASPAEAEPVEPVEPAAVPDEALAEAAGQLAHAVAARSRREEEQRQIHDPFPLPVRWRRAPEELTDHWANIRRAPAGSTAEPLALAGTLTEIVAVYRRIPSRRLVVLGRSGSGKTILGLRFVLDCLKSRARAEPVPVIFSIGSWNPTGITLRDWLAAQLTRDHPGLAAGGPGGTSLAAALVEAGWVLPILDGFDEIADGLRRPALEALNTTTLPLLLTSRPGEYAAAVAETDVLTSAAAIDLTDLTLDDLDGYLPRTTRKKDGAKTAWDPVLAELREHPATEAGGNLIAVLTTPLMVTLARAIYSDTPDHDPAALLDTARFGSIEALEEHLLDDFVPTVYRRLPGGPRDRFDPDRAQRWLGYLAVHLTRLGTPDLAWWQLGGTLQRWQRTVVTAVVAGLAIGLADVVVGLFFNGLVRQLFDGLVVGLLAGLMFGLVHWLTVASKRRSIAPSWVRLRLRGRTPAAKDRSVPRFLIGALCGFAFGSGYGLVVGTKKQFETSGGLADGLATGVGIGVVYGLVFALGAGLAFTLLGWLETPFDIRSAVSPARLLDSNRATVTAQFLVWVPSFGLVVGIAASVVVWFLRDLLGPLAWGVGAAVKLGTLSGLGGALGYAFVLTAWGQWVVFSRIWLPLTGRLPWAVLAFLDDAYQRGVLRQAGAVYQFRHARLQHHLTRAYQAHRGGPPVGEDANRGG